jgi:AcrR family transcriptional regulator
MSQCGTMWYRMSSERMMTATSPSRERGKDADEAEVRARILDAAFTAFMKSGYASTSTLEIATRARVSKRELYALVGNKHEMLIACIKERAKRLQVPASLPVPRDREALSHVLSSFGTQLFREVTEPAVVAVFRLAISEAVHAPEVAQTLDSIGRETSRTALRQIMAGAQASGLLEGRPAELAEQFSGLLWGTLMVSLLLGVTERPSSREISARARDATAAFLQLHPLPDGA